MIPTKTDAVYLQGEVEGQRVKLKKPLHRFHLYCSPHNLGAAELVDEIRQAFPKDLKVLQYTHDIGQLEDCDRMLLYPTRRTWTSGKVRP